MKAAYKLLWKFYWLGIRFTFNADIDIYIYHAHILLQLQGPSKLWSDKNCIWGPLKGTKSSFKPVHFFLHFRTFGLVVLQLILASKLSELEQFENFAANHQFRKKKRVKMTQKSDWCHCQAIKRCLWVGKWSPDSKIEF